MIDDDEFDYDDDYDFEESDIADEELRQEFELDDIRSNIQLNPGEAATKLNIIASDLTSIHSIHAALELLKIRRDRNTFLLLINAIAFGPQHIDSYSRLTILEQGWTFFDQQHRDDISQEDFLNTYMEVISILKSSEQQRLYLKGLLCMINTLITLNQLEDALDTLKSQFYTEISQYKNDTIWLPSLLYDANILEIDICMSMDPVDISWLNKAIHSSSTSRGISQSTQKYLVNEAQARLLIELSRCDEAKPLLESIVRGFEETKGFQVDDHLLIRSVSFLILVSTLLSGGSYEAPVELPVLTAAIANYPEVRYALKVSQCFSIPLTQASANEMFIALEKLRNAIKEHTWKLGSQTLLRMVENSFIVFQVVNVLKCYSRMRLADLTQRVKCSLDNSNVLPLSIIAKLILNNELPDQFRLNIIDGTLDKIKTYNDWREPVVLLSTSEQSIPLPQRYTERSLSQAKNQRESEILSRWKLSSNHSQSSVTRSIYEENNDERTHNLLESTLKAHREAMLR